MGGRGREKVRVCGGGGGGERKGVGFGWVVVGCGCCCCCCGRCGCWVGGWVGKWVCRWVVVCGGGRGREREGGENVRVRVCVVGGGRREGERGGGERGTRTTSNTGRSTTLSTSNWGISMVRDPVKRPLHHDRDMFELGNLHGQHNRDNDTLSTSNWGISIVCKTMGNCLCATTGMMKNFEARQLRNFHSILHSESTRHLSLHTDGHVNDL